MASYRNIVQIGEGAFGKAFRVKDSAGAMKVLKVCAEPEANQMAEEEYAHLCALRHPHIATVYRHFRVHGLLAFEMNYYVEGDLHGTIWRQTRGQLLLPGDRLHFPERDLLSWLKDMSSGVAHMHDQHIIHFDLKPPNCLFERERLVITDFGLATRVNQFQPTCNRGACGTEGFMAPEVENIRPVPY